MRKVLSLFMTIVVLFSLTAGIDFSAYAVTEVEINETNFPDISFREYIKENYDYNKNGVLSENEISQADYVNIYDKPVTTFQGVEYLTSLETLYCENNELTSIDISKNLALKSIRLGGNRLTELDVSKNTALKSLACGRNQLTSLDLSNNKELSWLSCSQNQLTTLDVSNNTALTDIYCAENHLRTLDLSNNTLLKTLECGFNQLTMLDLSNNPELFALYCRDNHLTSLDLSKNIKLNRYYFAYNNYTITLDSDNTFDLSTLPGNFDVSKASDWYSSDVNDNILTVYPNSDNRIHYYYDVGVGEPVRFELNIIPASHIHSYDDGVVIQEPTCNETGEKLITCTDCNDSYIEIIPAAGHNFDNDNSVCTICGEENPNAIAPTDPAAPPIIEAPTLPQTLPDTEAPTVLQVSTTVEALTIPPTAERTIKKASVKKPNRVKIKKLKKSKKSFKVYWKKLNGVTGYQVQYSTSKKFTKKKTKTVTVKGSKNTSKTIKRLKGKKKYYVRVRAYNKAKVNGKTKTAYGSWSKVRNVKPKM